MKALKVLFPVALASTALLASAAATAMPMAQDDSCIHQTLDFTAGKVGDVKSTRCIWRQHSSKGGSLKFGVQLPTNVKAKLKLSCHFTAYPGSTDKLLYVQSHQNINTKRVLASNNTIDGTFTYSYADNGSDNVTGQFIFYLNNLDKYTPGDIMNCHVQWASTVSTS